MKNIILFFFIMSLVNSSFALTTAGDCRQAMAMEAYRIVSGNLGTPVTDSKISVSDIKLASGLVPSLYGTNQYEIEITTWTSSTGDDAYTLDMYSRSPRPSVLPPAHPTLKSCSASTVKEELDSI